MNPHTYSITKTLNPNKGYSCVFRQWRAQSHCRFLHGYDLIFEVELACTGDMLTEEGWVYDYGGFKTLEKEIKDTFDHKVIVAADDPAFDEICALAGFDAADITVLPAVGCERFAEWLATRATDMLQRTGRLGAVRVAAATVYEHGGNRATIRPNHRIVATLDAEF